MVCSFIGFYYFCFPSSLDFLLQTLKFLSRFFWLDATFNEENFTSKLAKHLLNTLYKLQKHLGILNSDNFVKYVVCSTCKTLYDYKDCYKSYFGRQVSARCNFVPLFRDPHRSRRGKSTIKVTCCSFTQ